MTEKEDPQRGLLFYINSEINPIDPINLMSRKNPPICHPEPEAKDPYIKTKRKLCGLNIREGFLDSAIAEFMLGRSPSAQNDNKFDFETYDLFKLTKSIIVIYLE